MRQPVQFARRLPTIPASAPVRATQMDFSRPVSKSGSVGFACLSLGLAAMTFVLTTWSLDLPGELQFSDQLKRNVSSVVARAPVTPSLPVTEVDVVFEPKTTARLPVFGGLTPNNR